MNLRIGTISLLLSAVNIAVAQIEPFCRCTCNMRPLAPEVICSTESLSELCRAVTSLPDLVDTLSRTDLKYTIFAPNNDGFAKVDLDGLLDQEEDKEDLTALLLNHIIVGFEPICSVDLVCGNIMYMANSSQKGTRTKTACIFGEPGQGDDATGEPGEEPTAIVQKGSGNNNSKGNMPEIIGPDTRAKNAVIHIVNNVIMQ